MALSPLQIIAITGFNQNLGLGVSEKLVDAIESVKSGNSVTAKLLQLANHERRSDQVFNVMRTHLPGLSCVVPISVDPAPTAIVSKIVTDDLLALANKYFNNGVPGFLTRLGAASTACQSARDVLGSVYFLDNEGFKGMDPKASTNNDLLSGGISSRFGPTAEGSQDYLKASGLSTQGGSLGKSAEDIRRSINAVADAIDNLGTLYDFSRLDELGTAYGLIRSLTNQALISNDFIEKFRDKGIDPQALEQTSEIVLTGVLSEIKGIEVKKIIEATKLKLPTSSIIETAADFLKTEKLFTNSAISAIPGGTLINLSANLISLNVNFEKKEDLIAVFRNIKIVDTPNIESGDPLSREDIQNIRDSFPSGSADFGSPFLVEIIGTPSGYIHTDTFTLIKRTTDSVTFLDESQNLITAINDLITKYDEPPTVIEYDVFPPKNPDIIPSDATAEEAAFETAAITLAQVSAIVQDLESVNQAIGRTCVHLLLEEENQKRAGIDIEAHNPGIVTLSVLSSLIITLGEDALNSGASNLLLNIAQTNKYGEAVRGLLLQGENEKILKLIGKETIQPSDVEKIAAGLRAVEGEGLTQLQRENVIADANSRGLDIIQSLSNAAFYGYNSAYYESRGFGPA